MCKQHRWCPELPGVSIFRIIFHVSIALSKISHTKMLIIF